ncbi:MAG: phosphatidyl-myo-inositol alpha-mannosyltransferase [Solirubrobacterales bacterium]|nr:phosphatidyl-myo-inositol alpha-mannosyltransferase [Solirubrobacterales bacterium]
MRIALVSPYSWTYQGGVNRHIEALTEELLGRGHHVRVLAPWDPDDRLGRLLHRAPAEDDRRPDYLVPLGRTIGFGANGAVSNLCISPRGVIAMRAELRNGDFDVVHIHEPVAPVIGWDAVGAARSPVVGTFHAYSTKPMPNHIATALGARRIFNKLHARIAVSEAAAWTGRRFFGGDYRIIPNGVDVDAPPNQPKPASEELRVLFVGRPEERKGLPVLLTAFGGLVEHVPSRLTIIGADGDEIERYLTDPEVARHIDARGRVSHDELWRALHEADVLCAPSLAGESFGMVLTEAFAAGTPVIASAIAGYSDVVSDGVDGVLVPPADPQTLAEALQTMYVEPERRLAMGKAARHSADRYAWPRVADQVEEVYDLVQHAPQPATRVERVTRATGLAPVDGRGRKPPQRLPSLDPEPVPGAGRRGRIARRLALGFAGILGIGLTLLALRRVGISTVADSIVASDASLVLVAAGLMAASLFLRAASWYAIARAALPGRRLRRRDVTSATMIGVLMSATLPARLGEPARAMVLARRTGRMRETFPVLLGTLVSQTVLNIIALIGLGAIIVSTTDLFHSSSTKLFIASAAPLALLVAVLLAPVVLRSGGEGRIARAAESIQAALIQVRRGLRAFRDVRLGAFAAAAQLAAWGIQLLACYALVKALSLDHAGIGAAAAVLFAVNVTAVVPATPSNVGIFQLATISVLTTGFGVSDGDALAYGVILQAVEIATAVALGLPALVREGMTWSDLRLRALQAAPVRLTPHDSDDRKPAQA